MTCADCLESLPEPREQKKLLLFKNDEPVVFKKCGFCELRFCEDCFASHECVVPH